MLYLKLFIEFFKTGLFAIGGGLATLPFLQNIGDMTGWYSRSDLMDMFAVSESTPGPIGINMATYAGFKTAGIPGALIATFGLVLPSLIIIIIVASVLEKFKSNKLVQNGMYGLRPASVGLISAAVVTVLTGTFLNYDGFILIVDFNSIVATFNWTAILLAISIYIVIKLTNLHPAVYIFAAAAAGILLKLK